MVKLIKTSKDAAYSIAPGVTAEEAAEAGLAIVEYDYTGGNAKPIYGKYDDAPDGAPLGITTAKDPNMEVVGGGAVAPSGPPSAGNKGDLVNPNDPVLHGTAGEEVHADDAEPFVRDIQAEEKEAREIAEKSLEDASKSKPAAKPAAKNSATSKSK